MKGGRKPKDPKLIRLGAALKAVREERGLTQREMAEKLGVSLRSYCAYEAGEVHPRSILEPLQREFGVTTLELEIRAGIYSPREVSRMCADLAQAPVIYDAGNIVEKYYHLIPVITGVGAGGAIITADHVLYEGKYPPPKQVKGFVVKGNSMEPLVEDGDIVLIDVQNRDLVNGGVYLFARGDGNDESFLLLRTARLIDTEWYMVPENKTYPITKLTPEWVVVGKAVEAQTVVRKKL